jgi:hypothetical protein
MNEETTNISQERKPAPKKRTRAKRTKPVSRPVQRPEPVYETVAGQPWNPVNDEQNDVQDVSIQPEPPVERPAVLNNDQAPAGATTTVQHVMTDVESNLLYRAAHEEADWMAAIDIVDQYDLMRDPFELPEECKARQATKQFNYRWLNPADKERFDMQTNPNSPVRWWLCTRNTASYIPARYFDVNGLVRNQGLVLAKMPHDLYMIRQNRVWRAAALEPRAGQKPNAPDGMEYVPSEQAKLRQGDIIYAEEREVEGGRVVMDTSKSGRVYRGDN